ncbi:MAG TPA: hypothetical protein VFE35_03825 [Candidatus Cybelea sp.]|jgi:hypothetical protein|nr:hypothetical protein [Candidatus Cybelea sp.]
MKNVVPFRASETFERYGIDWTREPASEPEQLLREAFLNYESCCGMDGLISILLLSIVSRRQGTVAADLQAAADFAEIMLAMKARKHQDDTLPAIHSFYKEFGSTEVTDVALLLHGVISRGRPERTGRERDRVRHLRSVEDGDVQRS